MTDTFTSHFCTGHEVERAKPRARALREYVPTIDLHCHVLTLGAAELAATLRGSPSSTSAGPETAAQWSARYNQALLEGTYRPKLTDISVRLGDMDTMGIDIQVLSPSPTQYYYWAERDASAGLVGQQNQHIASICAAHPRGFWGLAPYRCNIPTSPSNKRGTPFATSVCGESRSPL